MKDETAMVRELSRIRYRTTIYTHNIIGNIDRSL